MPSQMTMYLGGDDDDDADAVLEITNPEEETFAKFNMDDDDVMELAGPGPGIDIKNLDQEPEANSFFATPSAGG